MIEKSYKDIQNILKNEEYYKQSMESNVNFQRSSTGSWEGLYVYQENGYFHLDYCERGRINSLVKSRDEDDIIYALVHDLIFNISVEHELNNRVEGEDHRRVLFAKISELYDQYFLKYSQRNRDHYELVLKRAPFSDDL